MAERTPVPRRASATTRTASRPAARWSWAAARFRRDVHSARALRRRRHRPRRDRRRPRRGRRSATSARCSPTPTRRNAGATRSRCCALAVGRVRGRGLARRSTSTSWSSPRRRRSARTATRCARGSPRRSASRRDDVEREGQDERGNGMDRARRGARLHGRRVARTARLRADCRRSSTGCRALPPASLYLLLAVFAAVGERRSRPFRPTPWSRSGSFLAARGQGSADSRRSSRVVGNVAGAARHVLRRAALWRRRGCSGASALMRRGAEQRLRELHGKYGAAVAVAEPVHPGRARGRAAVRGRAAHLAASRRRSSRSRSRRASGTALVSYLAFRAGADWERARWRASTRFGRVAAIVAAALVVGGRAGVVASPASAPRDRSARRRGTSRALPARALRRLPRARAGRRRRARTRRTDATSTRFASYADVEGVAAPLGHHARARFASTSTT